MHVSSLPCVPHGLPTLLSLFDHPNAYLARTTVIEQSKASTEFTQSSTETVNSNVIRGMVVYVRLFCVYVVLCLDKGLASG
jgi:hypothetical protein